MTDLERLKAECRRLGIDEEWADHEAEPGKIADGLQWISNEALTEEEMRYGRELWLRIKPAIDARYGLPDGS